MPHGLRAILGTSNRVKKPSRQAPQSASPSSSPRKTASSDAKTKTKTKSRSKTESRSADNELLFQDKFGDVGLVHVLAEDLSLRDVIQAMRYIRSHMFTPVPETGFTSGRTAELLNYRRAMPPLVTLGHLNAVLTSPPSAVEREIAELQGKGVVRKVRVDRRGGMGDGLIETQDYKAMLARSPTVSPAAQDALLAYLSARPTAQTVATDDEAALTSEHADELVRAGFLTAATAAAPSNMLHVRPEDRTTLTSIQHVSRFASGTVSAVGGSNAIHLAGGGGGAPALTRRATTSTEFRLAVPGHGKHLKLADGAVDWLREALARTKWGEGTEDWLRERFEGGKLYGPRWKEFWGVEWRWVLGQAVGLGVVEVFDTGSVGRGVRALGG